MCTTMKGFACIFVLGCLTLVSSLQTTKIDRDPTYYTCPFRIFNGGRPATNQLGETMYCDVAGVQCPHYHYCSAGYPDGRSICCHILGP